MRSYPDFGHLNMSRTLARHGSGSRGAPARRADGVEPERDSYLLIRRCADDADFQPAGRCARELFSSPPSLGHGIDSPRNSSGTNCINSHA